MGFPICIPAAKLATLDGLERREHNLRQALNIPPEYACSHMIYDRSTLEVLQYQDSQGNRQRLFEFYREVYPDSPWLLDDDRFIWQNLLPPLNGPNDSSIWLLKDGDKILGQNIYLRRPLSIAGEIQKGVCSTNLIVRSELVGKGLGHRMIEVNESLGGIPYAVGITPASIRAFQKRGWRLVNAGRLYSRFLRPGPNLRYVGASPSKRVVLTPALGLANLVSSAWRAACCVKKLAGVSVREISRFDQAHDPVWRGLLSDFAIHFDRTAELLNFKYCARSDVTHGKLLFERDGSPVGYGVCRLSEHPLQRLRLGRIVDFVYDPKLGRKLISFMIGVMVARLRAFGVDGLVAVASTSEIARALIDNGLFLSRAQRAIIKETDFSVDKLTKDHKHLWHITLGDSDLDDYW